MAISFFFLLTEKLCNSIYASDYDVYAYIVWAQGVYFLNALAIQYTACVNKKLKTAKKITPNTPYGLYEIYKQNVLLWNQFEPHQHLPVVFFPLHCLSFFQSSIHQASDSWEKKTTLVTFHQPVDGLATNFLCVPLNCSIVTVVSLASVLRFFVAGCCYSVVILFLSFFSLFPLFVPVHYEAIRYDTMLCYAICVWLMLIFSIPLFF